MCALALSVDSSSRKTCLAWFRSCLVQIMSRRLVSRQFWKGHDAGSHVNLRALRLR
jgi:hypothetical protein